MSISQGVKRNEVHLALEITAKNAMDQYNTDNSTDHVLKYENVKLSNADQAKLDNGDPFVSFKINYGSASVKILTTDEERQAGICIAKVHIRQGRGRIEAANILSEFINYFQGVQYSDYSLRINGVADGLQGQIEGEYWTEKLYVYFDYVKKGVNPNG